MQNEWKKIPEKNENENRFDWHYSIEKKIIGNILLYAVLLLYEVSFGKCVRAVVSTSSLKCRNRKQTGVCT